MDPREIILNIAVNLGRLCRFAMEGRKERVEQFLAQTDEYLKALESAPKSRMTLSAFPAICIWMPIGLNLCLPGRTF